MDYKTVYRGGEAEITEKKSRFLAEVFPISSEEDALEFIEKTRKKYWDARHHCWAYVLGEHQIQERCSDDGEPAGTAGRPILEVLRKNGLQEVLVIVTRYFGGTLLGTGGLVRAYTQAAQAGIQASTVITKTEGYRLSIETDYNGLGKIQYLLGQRGIPVVRSEYTDQVLLEVMVPVSGEQELIRAVTEATNGQAEIRRVEECRFADVNGEIVIFST